MAIIAGRLCAVSEVTDDLGVIAKGECLVLVRLTLAASGIFPFCLGRQPIPSACLNGEPRNIGVGVVPGHAHGRVLTSLWKARFVKARLHGASSGFHECVGTPRGLFHSVQWRTAEET